MPYSGVTKPSVGDPIKLSTINAIIDNQTHFNSSIGTASGFTADGEFETSPASGTASGWTDGTGAATLSRTNTTSDPNSGGEYCLKISGSAGESKYIESALFPISEYKPYAISLGCKVDNAADQITVSFITVQRNGSTPVQTVTNPQHSDGTNTGINNTTWRNYEWVVDGGANSRFAKVKIEWVCNGSSASAGYIDSFNVEFATKSEYRYYLPLFVSNGSHSISCYAPNWYRTTLTTFDDTTNDKNSPNPTSWLDMTTPPDAAQTSDFICDEVTKSGNQGGTIAGDGQNKAVNDHGVIVYTPRFDNYL